MKLPDYESDHCTIFSDFFLGLNPADLLTERHIQLFRSKSDEVFIMLFVLRTMFFS